jgi:hypothetical protein
VATFTLLDPTPGATAPPGPWAARPAPAASFSAGAGPEAGAPVWSAQLPEDAAEARAELAAAASGLERQERALDEAIARMARSARGGASFAAAQPAPERELQLVLEELRRPRGAASFSAGGEPPRWEQAQAQFRAFSAQVTETLRGYAVVETRVSVALVGRTSVGWTGNMRSLVVANISPDQDDLHRRTLGLALRSRVALLRTFVTVTRGAAIVATAISSPAGPLLALPAAWSFVSQLLDDMRAGQSG